MENVNMIAGTELIGRYLIEKGLTQVEAIQLIEKALKDKAYREEYNKREERKEYRADYNRKKSEAAAKVKLLEKRGCDIDDLLERMNLTTLEK